MLQDYPMYAYIPASDLDRARRFYETTVGLRPKEESNIMALIEEVPDGRG